MEHLPMRRYPLQMGQRPPTFIYDKSLTRLFSRSVTGNLRLVSSPGAEGLGTDAAFRLHTNSSHGSTLLNITEMSLDSVLHVAASTAHADLDLKMPPGYYDGNFSLSTTHGEWYIMDSTRGVPDPAGQGRKRSIWEWGVTGTHVEGMVVWWPPRNRQRGVINMAAANGDVTLRV
jgi:hypothetical protein